MSELFHCGLFRKVLSVGFVLLVVNRIAFHAQASEDFQLERSVYVGFVHPTNVFYVDLGEMPVNTRGTIKLLVNNNSENSMKINRIGVGCSCISVKSFGDHIKSKSVLELEMKLTVPDRINQAKQVQLVTLEETKERYLQIGVVFQVSGALSFTSTSVTKVLAPGENTCTLRIPVVLTAPVVPNDVSATGTGELSEFVGKIIREDGQYYLIGSIKFDVASTLGMSGSLNLEDKIRGVRSTISCNITRDRDISVAPHVLRFTKTEGKLVARAILRVHKSTLIDGKVNNSLDVRCSSSSGAIVSVDSTKIGEGVYRISLEINEAALSNSQWPESIQWSVIGGKDELQLTTSVAKTL